MEKPIEKLKERIKNLGLYYFEESKKINKLRLICKNIGVYYIDEKEKIPQSI